MSFNITLMRNSSPVNKVDKSLSTITTLTGTLKEDTSIINPVIKVQCNLSDVKYCNYMYISSFGRYYFVNDITSITNNIVEISAHVDVLTSFSSELRTNSGIVKRQENNWNTYLDDGSFKVYQNPLIVTKSFPSGFTTQEFVLAVAGS